MDHIAVTQHARSVSPLVLADRLITLAQDADRAGYRDAASSIVTLAYSVLEGGRA